MSFINNKNIWEVDLLLERSMVLHSVEIKLSSTITESRLKNFSLLRNAVENLHGDNLLVCGRKVPLRRGNTRIGNWGAL